MTSRALSSPFACAALLLALALPACRVVGPAYERPDVAVPAAFRGAGASSSASRQSVADLPWWTVFHDEALASLVRAAVENNHDLAAALARVDEARALAGVARADRFPQIEGDAGFSRDRSSRSVQSSGARTTSNYRAAIAASWEIDLWGRIARGQEAAFADYLGSEDGRLAAIVTLVADVAQAYFELRELDVEREIAVATMGTRTKTRDLFGQRLSGGMSSRLETSQAEADLAATASLVPELERQIAQKENLLSFLVGLNPGAIARGSALIEPAIPPEVPAGIPAEILERRPDLRAAEAAVRAANARVGVAQAERLPRVSLTALLGLESRDLKDLVNSKSAIGSLGAGLLAPISQGGRLDANVCVAVAQWHQAVALYKKAAQSAFRDVADRLVDIEKLRQVRAEEEREVKALEESLSLAGTRYEGGLSAYFEVLDAQRRLFPSQILLARTKRDQRLALVGLYRALGGGWQTAPAGPLPAAR